MTALRVGAVGYLNARPLVRGLCSSGLFSVRFDYRRPVKTMRFWLFADGSGATFTPRVRDSSGECFAGAPSRLDWSTT